MLGFQFNNCTVVIGVVFGSLFGSDWTIESLQMILSVHLYVRKVKQPQRERETCLPACTGRDFH